jgi:putative endonuclease
MAGHTALGRAGESIAARYLEGLGYEIRDRNFRCSFGEVDLVAVQGEYLVFVEVKTRKAGSMVAPEWAVTPAKQARIRQVCEHYMAERDAHELQPRFDVVAIRMGRSEDEDRIEHYPNAF